jgi:hypothetical protein
MISHDTLLIFEGRHIHLLRLADPQEYDYVSYIYWTHHVDVLWQRDEMAISSPRTWQNTSLVTFSAVDIMITLEIPLKEAYPTDPVSKAEWFPGPPNIIISQINTSSVCSISISEETAKCLVHLCYRAPHLSSPEDRAAWDHARPARQLASSLQPLTFWTTRRDDVSCRNAFFDEWTGEIVLLMYPRWTRGGYAGSELEDRLPRQASHLTVVSL